MKKIEKYVLTKKELDILKATSERNGLNFNPNKNEYTLEELKSFGVVKTGYSKEEMLNLGFGLEKINSFQQKAINAKDLLKIDTPFGSGIEKWQLPIDTPYSKMHMTIFSPNTHVAPHSHSQNNSDNTGGSLRVVIKGSLSYEGKEYKAGDWFFIPDCESYEFLSDLYEDTVVLYKWTFDKVENMTRFSHPRRTNKSVIESVIEE